MFFGNEIKLNQCLSTTGRNAFILYPLPLVLQTSLYNFICYKYFYTGQLFVRSRYYYFRLAQNGTKSRLGSDKYDGCSNQHFSTTICAIISLRVCIDINCARTFHLKKTNFILSVSHNFTHILISFFLVEKCQKTLFFTTKNFNFFEKILPHISRRYFFQK